MSREEIERLQRRAVEAEDRDDRLLSLIEQMAPRLVAIEARVEKLEAVANEDEVVADLVRPPRLVAGENGRLD